MAQYDRKDHYYQKAKASGRASRACFKLEEMQKRFRLVRSGSRVLDLGCAPGGWLQPLAEWVGETGRVIGVDLKAIRIPLPPHVTCLQSDIEEIADAPAGLLEKLGGQAHAVFSDMAPNTTGTRFQDQMQSIALAEMAWICAEAVLAPGGHFVVKIFEGPDVANFRRKLQQLFEKVTTFDPKSTRKGSFERYFVCQRCQSTSEQN